MDALRTALVNAKSVAYSDSASGVYVENELFKRLGIEEQMKGKARMIPAEPVAAVVARGEAELGFQQISELLPVAGVDVVGPIPESVQKITIFSAGISSKAGSPKAGADLTAFLASPQAAPVISKTGLDPHRPSGREITAPAAGFAANAIAVWAPLASVRPAGFGSYRKP